MLRIAPHSDHHVDARFGGGLSALEMQHGTVLAEFEHFSGDKDSSLGGAKRERADHGTKRFGIGIVAVIEDDGAVDVEGLTALVAGSECGEGRASCVDVDT